MSVRRSWWVNVSYKLILFNLIKNKLQVDHENIVKLVDVFECDHKLHLIMEYCSGGDLRTLIRKTQKSEQQFTYEQV